MREMNPPSSAHPRTARERFDLLARDYLAEALRLQPTLASSLGFHPHDGELEDLSPAGLTSAVASLQRFQSRLEREVDPGSLDLSRRIDHRLLLEDVTASRFRLEELQSHRWDPSVYNEILGYSTLFLTLLPDGAPEWPDRLASLTSRLRRFPDLLSAARENLSEPSRVHVDYVIGANRANIAFLEASLPALAGRVPALRGELLAAGNIALQATRDYQTWLEQDLRSRAGRRWRLGRELWERKLRFTLQSDLSPDAIWRRAEQGLRAEREAMLEIAEPLHARYFPTHSHDETGEARIDRIVSEVIARISDQHSQPATILADVERWVRKIKTFLRGADLVTLPPESDAFVLEPTPGFLDGLAVAFFNPPPAFEPHLKKSFWISSVEGKPEEFVRSYLREYNDCALQNLTIHEAFPGHYVQFWHALNSPVASIYKKVFASSTFAEGWAVWAEKLVYAAGYADGEPENLLIHKKMQLRTYINAMLDQRFHVASPQEVPDEELEDWALDLMCRQGFQEEAEATGKMRRAKVSSTQLSTYFAGYLEISDLAEAARRAAGPAFRPRAFHDRLLSFGTIPPREVRRLLQEQAAI